MTDRREGPLRDYHVSRISAQFAAREKRKSLEIAGSDTNEEKVGESASSKGESNKVDDLVDPEKKALDELKLVSQDALNKHKFTVPPPPAKEEPKVEEVVEKKAEEATPPPLPATEEPSETAVKKVEDKVASLILENTFTSILDMAGVLLLFLKWFIGKSGSKGPKVLNFLVCPPCSTIDVNGEVKQPIFFLSGLQDEMVPPSHMEMLYAKVAARKQHCSFVDFPTCMHMDTWLAAGDRYWRTVQEFIPSVEGGYTWIGHKSRKIGPADEQVVGWYLRDFHHLHLEDKVLLIRGRVDTGSADVQPVVQPMQARTAANERDSPSPRRSSSPSPQTSSEDGPADASQPKDSLPIRYKTNKEEISTFQV